MVSAHEIDFATELDLYGLYASRHAAQDALRALADEHRLCYGALGLEKLTVGKACFRASLRMCAGVCRGDETPHTHQQRLFTELLALRVNCWPHPGAVGLVEQDGDFTQVHVVRNWCYLGSAASIEEAKQLSTVAAGFDADGYKILVRPMLGGLVPVVGL